MRKRTLLALLASIIFVLPVAAQSNIMPGVREWTPSGGTLKLSPSTKVIIHKKYKSQLSSSVNTFVSDWKSISTISPVMSEGTSPSVGSIFFTIDTSLNITPEGYQITIKDFIEVKCVSTLGASHAMQTLLQCIKVNKNYFEKGKIVDFPTHGDRGIMIDVGRRYYQMDYLKRIIRLLAWYKMNTLHLHFNEWSAFRLNSSKYPGLAAKDSYTKEDVRDLQDYAKRYNITIVPEIDVPAHATVLTDYKPDLAFKCQSMRESRWQGEVANKAGKAWTLDITRPEVRAWINDLMEEFIPWFDGPYFHVGGDEYQYDPEKFNCPELMQAMKEKGYSRPGDIFVEWVNELNVRVRSHGKTTQIWTWWNFLRNETSIKPSKDIIIIAWNKPIQKQLIDDGYKVIITPEEELYVTPGIGEAGDTTGYGIVNCQKIYEEWVPEEASNILGYKLCIWADLAEHHTDEWFDGKSFEPRAILAEKIWAGAKSKNLKDFLYRVNTVGMPPVVN